MDGSKNCVTVSERPISSYADISELIDCEELHDWLSVAVDDLGRDQLPYFILGGQIGGNLFLDDAAKIISRAVELSNKRPEEIKEVALPLDKATRLLWKQTGATEHPILLDLRNRADKEKDLPVAICRYLIDLSGLSDRVPELQRLSYFDFLVFRAICTLCGDLHEMITTPTRIYHAIGGMGRPSKQQIGKILKSIDNMSKIRLSVDTLEEIQRYDYPRIQGTRETLVNAKFTATVVGGVFTECAIKFYDVSILYRFAKAHGQITKTPLAALQAPISRTETNIALMDYLQDRIAKAKNGTLSRNIKLSTVFSECGVTEKKARQRAKKTLVKLLDYYTPEVTDKEGKTVKRGIGLINGYKLHPDKIEILKA